MQAAGYQETDQIDSSQIIMKPFVAANGQNKIAFMDREYFLIGSQIISDENALEIYEKLLKETQDPQRFKRT